MLQTIDDFIIDQVFQPVVNRFEIDPRRLARHFLAGVVICCLVLSGLMLPRSLFAAVANLFPALSFASAWQSPYFMMRHGFSIVRCFMVVSFLVLIVFDILSANGTREIELVVTLVEHWGIIFAIYLAACSKPPPRRRRAPVWAVSAT